MDVVATNIHELRTDAVIAKDLRAELEPIGEALAIVFTKARNAGLTLTLQIAPDAFGRFVPTITILKPL